MSEIFPVSLHVYDLSGSMARQFSRQLVGSQINGVWSTGIVVHGREYYYGGGISYDLPGKTPFGKFNDTNFIRTLSQLLTKNLLRIQASRRKL